MRQKIGKIFAFIEKFLWVMLAIIFAVLFCAQIFVWHTDATITGVFIFMLLLGVWAISSGKEE